VVRGRRSTLVGVGTAAAVLAAVVAVLGPALRLIPIDSLRFVVGALLFAFGIQWLRKAVLRASGYKPPHDEGAAFQRTRVEAEGAGQVEAGRMDWYSFTVAFKGVLLEGLEVTFIVVTSAARRAGSGLPPAPRRLPFSSSWPSGSSPARARAENALKFGVGVLLTSFGIFWGGEGAGVSWPGENLAILGAIAYIALLSLVLTPLLRRSRPVLEPVATRA
jgi:uncharacterized membrane protein